MYFRYTNINKLIYKKSMDYISIRKSILNKERNVYSYGKFISDNPKCTKEERIKAILFFLNNTR